MWMARRRTVALGRAVVGVMLLALAAGCGPGVGLTGTDGGAARDGGGAPVGTWHLFYPSDRLDGHVAMNSALLKDGKTTVGTWDPGPKDPWLLDLTPRVLHSTDLFPGGLGKYRLELAISGATVTVIGRDEGTSNGYEAVTSVATLDHVTWCYRPVAAATKVRFTATMKVGSLSVNGRDGDVSAELANFGGGPCRARTVFTSGAVTKTPASCTSEHIDVPEAADGIACLGGDGDDPILEIQAIGGRFDASGTTDAVAEATFTVTATPIP